jgi:hypothetical protein
MLSPSATKMQQSLQVGGPAGSWRLAPGQALSLYPRNDGVLRITRGRAWVTLDVAPSGHGNDAGDHCLLSGEQLVVQAGRHLVFESLDTVPVCFEWVPVPAVVPLKATRWEDAVVLPLADLWQAARLAAGALGRLVWGLAGYPPLLVGGAVAPLLRRRVRRVS